jgi:L-alanine-DL-glutamate epimerase-like enolase superfamily enzyme
MKITDVRTALVDIPLPAPVKTAIHDIRSAGAVLVSVDTDDSVTGEGIVFAMNGDRLDALDKTVRGLAPRVIGRDPAHVEAIWQDIYGNDRGNDTVAVLSAFDTACWDIVGKALDWPLYRIFGASRERVPTYASGGLWLSRTIDELVAEARDFVAAGFRAMKLRVGNARPLDDVERAAAVREAIGPDIALMVDANQGFDAAQAIALGRALAPFDIGWFEEPVAATDRAGHAEVRAAVPMAVASGENEFTRYGIRALIEAGGADVLMPDLQRIGGLTEMRRAAALAAAYDLPVSTHIFTEQSLSLAGSAPNCMSVEHMPWFAPLYREKVVLEDGDLLMPTGPGLGFTFDPDSVDRYRIG